jgi:3'(2'), 5'-bisphosphate nucleotidase
MSVKLRERLFLDAIHAAQSAGAAIMRVYEGAISVSTKIDNSPLTQADLDAQKCIIQVLDGSGIPVISEESSIPEYANRSHWERFWLVDPLDGTKEFIHRNGEFTVNIAMMEKGIPAFGVVFSPATDQLFAGWTGYGVWHVTSASRHRFHSLEQLDEFQLAGGRPQLQPYTVAVSRSHRGPIEVLQAGSSMKFCLVAAGKADEYPRFGPTHEWDTAAGHAVLLAAGKDIYSMEDGKRLTYNKPLLKHGAFISR